MQPRGASDAPSAHPAARPPGMVDVARVAGVSQKTVSRVINGERYVSDDFRQRVLEAAQRLGYRRNTAAHALITGRFRSIGVASLGTALYGPASMLIALERATRAAGFSFTVASTLEGQDKVSPAIERLLEQGVDGIVISEPVDEGEELTFDPRIPVLSLGQTLTLPGSHNMIVGTDGLAAARTATEHLLDLGHRTVWHVAGPWRWFPARDRLEGWRQALEAAGAVVPPVIQGDWSPASGYAAGTELAADPDVTAVFVANDEMALGVMRGLTKAGRRVPGDVSIVGFDDIPAAPYLSPPLTTMRQDFDAVASRGLDLLIREIDGAAASDAEPARLAIPARLIVRESTTAR